MTENVSLSLVGTGANPEGRPATDFYSTPAWATRALLARETFNGSILEPACGDGSMSKVLEEKYFVGSYDLYDHGYEHATTGYDFTGNDVLSKYGVRWGAVITNPPYRHAEKFLENALDLALQSRGKVALLLKLQFLEGIKRSKMLKESPLRNVYVFSKRLTFTRNNEPLGNSGMMAFAWYVWDWEQQDCNMPHLDWI